MKDMEVEDVVIRSLGGMVRNISKGRKSQDASDQYHGGVHTDMDGNIMGMEGRRKLLEAEVLLSKKQTKEARKAKRKQRAKTMVRSVSRSPL